MPHCKHALIALALLCVDPVRAQQPPAPPPPRDGVVPALMLATVPELSAVQQTEVRRIFMQQRDAAEAIRQKTRSEMEALHAKERAEHERIDAQATEQLRKLLGDDGLRRFAQWQFAHGPATPDAHRPPPHAPGPPGAATMPPHGADEAEPAAPIDE